MKGSDKIVLSPRGEKERKKQSRLSLSFGKKSTSVAQFPPVKSENELSPSPDLKKHQSQPEKRSRNREDRHTITLAHSPQGLLAALEEEEEKTKPANSPAKNASVVRPHSARHASQRDDPVQLVHSMKVFSELELQNKSGELSEASRIEAKKKLIDKLQKQMKDGIQQDVNAMAADEQARSNTESVRPRGSSIPKVNEIIALVGDGKPTSPRDGSAPVSPSADNTIVRKVRREVEITLTMEKELEQERESVREKERLAEEVLNERKRLTEKITLERKLAEERKRSLNMEQSILDIREAERKIVQDELKLERELARERKLALERAGIVTQTSPVSEAAQRKTSTSASPSNRRSSRGLPVRSAIDQSNNCTNANAEANSGADQPATNSTSVVSPIPEISKHQRPQSTKKRPQSVKVEQDKVQSPREKIPSPRGASEEKSVTITSSPKPSRREREPSSKRDPRDASASPSPTNTNANMARPLSSSGPSSQSSTDSVPSSPRSERRKSHRRDKKRHSISEVEVLRPKLSVTEQLKALKTEIVALSGMRLDSDDNLVPNSGRSMADMNNSRVSAVKIGMQKILNEYQMKLREIIDALSYFTGQQAKQIQIMKYLRSIKIIILQNPDLKAVTTDYVSTCLSPRENIIAMGFFQGEIYMITRLLNEIEIEIVQVSSHFALHSIVKTLIEIRPIIDEISAMHNARDEK